MCALTHVFQKERLTEDIMSNVASRILVTAVSTFAAGLAVGLLVSPHSGSENRRLIAARVKEQSKKMEDQLKEMEGRFEELEKHIVETGTEVTERLKASASDAINQLKGEDVSDEWSVDDSEVAADLKRMPRK